ncbi:hypothetical protein GCM10027093_42930 [Paraburkholderia jirisanensis]
MDVVCRDGAGDADTGVGAARAGAAALPFVAAFGRARGVRAARTGTGAAVAAVASGAVLFLLMSDWHVPKKLYIATITTVALLHA